MSLLSKYRGVEALLFKGFLTTKVSFEGLVLVLKSLNIQELDLIADQCPLRSDPSYSKEFESLMLAYAIYMIDGQNVLRQRPDSIHSMRDYLKSAPERVRTELLHELLTLQQTQDVELQRLEAYSYEPTSRHIWASMKGHVPNDTRLTGISGTDKLGLNSHQKAWYFLNQAEDERLALESDWSVAKFVASAYNSKGVKKFDDKDKARLKRLHEERERIRQGIEASPAVLAKRGPRSVEDLHAQLQADLTGKKDLHDMIVSDFETSLAEMRRKRAERAEHERQEALRRAEEDRDTKSDEDLIREIEEGGGFLQVLSKEQLESQRRDADRRREAYIQRVQDQRQQHIRQYQKDREEIARRTAQRMSPEDIQSSLHVPKQGPPTSLDIPTDSSGPLPTRISSSPQEGGELSSVGPSRRLTRKYGEESTRVIVIEPEDEDMFFGGTDL